MNLLSTAFCCTTECYCLYVACHHIVRQSCKLDKRNTWVVSKLFLFPIWLTSSSLLGVPLAILFSSICWLRYCRANTRERWVWSSAPCCKTDDACFSHTRQSRGMAFPPTTSHGAQTNSTAHLWKGCQCDRSWCCACCETWRIAHQPCSCQPCPCCCCSYEYGHGSFQSHPADANSITCIKFDIWFRIMFCGWPMILEMNLNGSSSKNNTFIIHLFNLIWTWELYVKCTISKKGHYFGFAYLWIQRYGFA